MKKIISRWGPVLAAASLLVTTGCNTVSTNSFQYVGGPIYPATSPAQIAVLREMPSRPHVNLGEITAQPANDSVGAAKIETALQNAAAPMGANAVVITSDRMQITGAYVTGPWYGRSVNTTSARVVTGVAIRYTGN